MHYSDEKSDSQVGAKTPAEESRLELKENNRAHTVLTEFGERNDCVL